jgi:PAS domain-containing protein
VPRAVLTLIRAKDKEVIEVNGVKSTFNHPFLTEEGHFKVAAQLSMFDRLVNAEGELVRVESIVNRGERANVFNFEVEEHHTYVAGGYRVHNWKPVIVDLNGNGVEFMGASMSTARFDVDGDGNLERTAWVASSDGLLVFDHDHDGMISNVNEVALSMYGQEGMTDLQGLAYGFDSNRDGVFNHEDDQWSSFAIWQDANSNGVSEAGEVISLDDIGISSIGLNRDDNQYSEDGVTVYGYGSFEWSDGSSGQLADTAFEARSENFWDSDVASVLNLEADTIVADPVQMAELLVMHGVGAAGGVDNIPAPSTDILIVDDDYLALISANA